MENYREIPGYEGKYSVSDLGNVISLRSGKLLVPKYTNGYAKVCLSINNTAKTFKVHQLMAMTFLGHTLDNRKIVVDHIDNNRSNNTLANLRILTQRENVSRHKTRELPTGVRQRAENRYQAVAMINGTITSLGYYATPEEASIAYKNATSNL